MPKKALFQTFLNLNSSDVNQSENKESFIFHR